jgi:hypothetical protein
MRLLFLLLAVLAPAIAHADDSVTAAPLASADYDARGALAHAVSKDATCSPLCDDRRRAAVELKTGARVEAHVVGAGGVYVVVRAKKGGTWAASAAPIVVEGDCGMGKCVEQSIGDVRLRQASGGGIALTVRVESVVTRNDRRIAMARSSEEWIVACRPTSGGAWMCTPPVGQGPFVTSRAWLDGDADAIVERYEGEDHRTSIVWP